MKSSIHTRQISIPITNIQPRVDEKGQKRCLNCDAPVPSSNRKYCSLKCSTEFFRKHNWSELRQHIIVKQNWTCQACHKVIESTNTGFTSHSNIVVDHIIPIALGGAEFDENNLQVLCSKCNKRKTKQDQANIARHRLRSRRGQSNIPVVGLKKLFTPTLEQFTDEK